MPSFTIENFGCRATESDAVALRQQLLASGLTLATEHSVADYVVLNTCTVTAAADSQAREAVRKIHRANPAAQIVVTGCYAQRAPEELAAICGISWVVGNSHQADIPRLIRESAPSQASSLERASARDFIRSEDLRDDPMSLARGPGKILTGDIFAHDSVQIAPAAQIAGDRTRPILKIQDGCNNRCSYCVIPFVRGRGRSLQPDAVIEEVRKLVSMGAKEVVLSGINLGSYGRDLPGRTNLAGIAARILHETELEQLRFSSIEPQDVTEDFVSLVEGSGRIAHHFHVPLQSGSNRILRAMHRWYRAELYAERMRLIRRLIPDAAIGADVIVGFPGETNEDFRTTADFIEQLPFTYLHVFSFSARPGTKAENLDALVSAPSIRERAQALRALAQKKAAAFRASQEGSTLRALTLARSGDGWTEALTGNYLKVRIAGHYSANEWRSVQLGPEGSCTELSSTQISAFENHFGEGQISAVRDRERDISHA
jgi:threonylcarbamoyladenosine tRNA methylthiotransferase MtaB